MCRLTGPLNASSRRCQLLAIGPIVVAVMRRVQSFCLAVPDRDKARRLYRELKAICARELDRMANRPFRS